MYICLADAKMRLEGCLIRYKGEPIYVHVVEQPRVHYILVCEYIRDRVGIRLKIADRQLDFHPVPLGNMNHEGNVYYATRTPQRMWKQGLHRDSFICRHLRRGFVSIPLLSKALLNTIAGTYPSVRQCVKQVDDGVMISSAFSRNFSVMPDRNLVFNCKLLIGSLNEDLKTFRLADNYQYLKEHLQNSMIGQ